MLQNTIKSYCKEFFFVSATYFKGLIKELNQLAESNPKIHVLQLDVENDDDLKEAVKQVEKLLNGQGLNVIINNAAMLTVYLFIMCIFVNNSFQVSGAEYKNPDRKTIQQHMSVNVVAPICVAGVGY